MTNENFNAKTLIFTKDWVFYTVQGEGRFTGVPSVFVRLSGCNLRCQWSNGDGTTTICDTPYSSHKEEQYTRTINDTIEEILKYNCRHVVITGGEPHYQKEVAYLINRLVDLHKYVTIETNGTIFLDHKASFLSISPKLATSCIPQSKHFESHHSIRMNIDALAKLVKKDHQLKFVVERESDIQDVDIWIDLLREANGEYDESNIYLMPQGTTQEQLDKKLPWIIEVAKTRKWNITDRFHIRAFGSKRGV